MKMSKMGISARSSVILILMLFVVVGVVREALGHPVTAGSKAKVTICHKPGTPDEKTLEVPAEAVPAYVAHGDIEGKPCGADPPTIAVAWIEGDNVEGYAADSDDILIAAVYDDNGQAGLQADDTIKLWKFPTDFNTEDPLNVADFKYPELLNGGYREGIHGREEVWIFNTLGDDNPPQNTVIRLHGKPDHEMFLVQHHEQEESAWRLRCQLYIEGSKSTQRRDFIYPHIQPDGQDRCALFDTSRPPLYRLYDDVDDGFLEVLNERYLLPSLSMIFRDFSTGFYVYLHF